MLTMLLSSRSAHALDNVAAHVEQPSLLVLITAVHVGSTPVQGGVARDAGVVDQHLDWPEASVSTQVDAGGARLRTMQHNSHLNTV